eukprot:6790-Heterococcus_DN1.PRE.1
MTTATATCSAVTAATTAVSRTALQSSFTARGVSHAVLTLLVHQHSCYYSWCSCCTNALVTAGASQLFDCSGAVRDQEEVATLWKQHTAGLRKALAQRDTLLHAYRSELASCIAALGQAAAQAKQIEHTAVAAVSVRRTAVLAMHSCCNVHLCVQQR